MIEREYQVYESNFKELPNGNLFDALELSAKKYPDHYAIIDERENTTYRELIAQVNRLADYLAYCGINSQDSVGLLFVNEVNFVISFYALAKLGAIAVMVNTKLQPPEIRYVLEDTETRVLLLDHRWIDKVSGFAFEIGIKWMIFSDDITKIKREDPKDNHIKSKTAQGGWNTVALMHTSGTTGKPKGVMISHRNILETAYGYQEVQGLTAEDVTVLSVPIFHILGLSCVTTNFLTIGGTVVLSDFYNPNQVLRNITRYHATHFHSVPTVFLQIMREYQEKPQENFDVSTLRIAVCGGALISEHDISRFCQMVPSASFRLAYGMTETAGGGTLSPGHRMGLKPTPNVAVDIVDRDGNPVPAGVNGQVIFKGPVVVRRFWKGREVVNGHLESGDLAWRDDQGYIHVTDRLKDLISRGGEKILPSEVENALKEYQGIKEAAVFAVVDALYGELPAAVVTLESGFSLDLDALYNYLKGRIAKYELPCKITVWEELPKTSNGKVKKAELRAEFEKERVME